MASRVNAGSGRWRYYQHCGDDDGISRRFKRNDYAPNGYASLHDEFDSAFNLYASYTTASTLLLEDAKTTDEIRRRVVKYQHVHTDTLSLRMATRVVQLAIRSHGSIEKLQELRRVVREAKGFREAEQLVAAPDRLRGLNAVHHKRFGAGPIFDEAADNSIVDKLTPRFTLAGNVLQHYAKARFPYESTPMSCNTRDPLWRNYRIRTHTLVEYINGGGFLTAVGDTARNGHGDLYALVGAVNMAMDKERGKRREHEVSVDRRREMLARIIFYSDVILFDGDFTRIHSSVTDERCTRLLDRTGPVHRTMLNELVQWMCDTPIPAEALFDAVAIATQSAVHTGTGAHSSRFYSDHLRTAYANKYKVLMTGDYMARDAPRGAKGGRVPASTGATDKVAIWRSPLRRLQKDRLANILLDTTLKNMCTASVMTTMVEQWNQDTDYSHTLVILIRGRGQGLEHCDWKNVNRPTKFGGRKEYMDNLVYTRCQSEYDNIKRQTGQYGGENGVDIAMVRVKNNITADNPMCIGRRVISLDAINAQLAPDSIHRILVRDPTPPRGGSALPPGGGSALPPGGESALPPRGGESALPPGGGSAMPPRGDGIHPLTSEAPFGTMSKDADGSEPPLKRAAISDEHPSHKSHGTVIVMHSRTNRISLTGDITTAANVPCGVATCPSCPDPMARIGYPIVLVLEASP